MKKIKEFVRKNKYPIMMIGVTGAIYLFACANANGSNFNDKEKVDIYVNKSELEDMVTDIWIKGQETNNSLVVSLNRKDSEGIVETVKNILEEK